MADVARYVSKVYGDARLELEAQMTRLLSEELHSDLVVHTGANTHRLHCAVLAARCPALLAALRSISQRSTESLESRETMRQEPCSLCIHLPAEVDVKLEAVRRSAYSSVHCSTLHEQTGELVDTMNHAVGNAGNCYSRSDHETSCTHSKAKHAVDFSSPCCLGGSLLSLLENDYMYAKETSDIQLEVDGSLIPCHRCVLASRCDFFNAMFMPGHWREESSPVIKLDGFSRSAVDIVLKFIYGGVLALPDDVSLREILRVSDYLMLSGLSGLISAFLRVKKCAFFANKVNDSTIVGILETLKIASDFSLSELTAQCILWVSGHFSKVWSHRHFLSLTDGQLSVLASDMETRVVRGPCVEFLIASDCLLSSTVNGRAQALVSRIFEASLSECARRFPQCVLQGHLDCLAKGIGCNVSLLSKIFDTVVETLSEGTCCLTWSSAHTVAQRVQVRWDEEAAAVAQRCEEACLRYVRQRLFRVVRTTDWQLLSAAEQQCLRQGSGANFVRFDPSAHQQFAKCPVRRSPPLSDNGRRRAQPTGSSSSAPWPSTATKQPVKASTKSATAHTAERPVEQVADSSSDSSLRVGSSVRLPSDQLGTVRFIGKTQFALGEWVGVELVKRGLGKNDGAVQGVRYFHTNSQRGLFVRRNTLRPAQLADAGKENASDERAAAS